MKRLLYGAIVAIAACAPTPPPAPPEAAASPPAPAPSPSAAPPSAAYASDPMPAGTFILYEDFEKGFDRWALPDPAASPGFRQLNAPACGGAWSIVLGVPNHAPFVPVAGHHELALKAPVDLTKARRPFLKFDVKGVTFPAEAVTMRAEIRGADGAWTPVGRVVHGGYVFMASIGADLTAWVGQQVGLRFRAETRAGEGPSRGLYLDDIQIIEPSTPR